MSPEILTQLATEALMMVLQLCAPLVGAAACVGLLFGFLQAITQLQDQTTTFAVKLIVVMGLLLVLLPWMGVQINGYGERMFEMVMKVKR
jgi:type III secretion HrpO family protein